jgi:hypothetical protein
MNEMTEDKGAFMLGMKKDGGGKEYCVSCGTVVSLLPLGIVPYSTTVVPSVSMLIVEEEE